MKTTIHRTRLRARKGDWFITFTGRQFFPLDPRPEDICIEDIAHSLANICRFGGHCREFYSVAQHSVHVSFLVPQIFSLVGLMHDAAEAYVGDMVRPLKRFMPEFKSVERSVWLAIAERFSLPREMDPIVKLFDNVALLTERRDLVAPTDFVWVEDERGIVIDKRIIKPSKPIFAEREFLYRFNELNC